MAAIALNSLVFYCMEYRLLHYSSRVGTTRAAAGSVSGSRCTIAQATPVIHWFETLDLVRKFRDNWLRPHLLPWAAKAWFGLMVAAGSASSFASSRTAVESAAMSNLQLSILFTYINAIVFYSDVDDSEGDKQLEGQAFEHNGFNATLINNIGFFLLIALVIAARASSKALAELTLRLARTNMPVNFGVAPPRWITSS